MTWIRPELTPRQIGWKRMYVCCLEENSKLRKRATTILSGTGGNFTGPRITDVNQVHRYAKAIQETAAGKKAKKDPRRQFNKEKRFR